MTLEEPPAFLVAGTFTSFIDPRSAIATGSFATGWGLEKNCSL